MIIKFDPKSFDFFPLFLGIVVKGTMVITIGKSKGETLLLHVVKVVSIMEL